MSAHDDTPSLFPEPTESRNDAVEAATRPGQRGKNRRKGGWTRTPIDPALTRDEHLAERKRRNAERMRVWRAENKEEYSRRCKERYPKVREQVLAQKKVYYRENQERILLYNAQYREENRELLRQYQAEYRLECPGKIRDKSKANYRAGKDYIDSILASSSCGRCGELNPKSLCFHHDDPSEKTANVSHLCASGRERIDAEIAKCHVLCHSCHKILHAFDGEMPKPYRYSPEETRTVEEILADPTPMAAKRKELERAKRRARVAESRALLRAYKAERGCSRCPQKHPDAIEFHHPNPEKMEVRVSALQAGSRKKMWAEVRRTVLLCGNCHAKHHAIFVRGQSAASRKRRLKQPELPFGD